MKTVNCTTIFFLDRQSATQPLAPATSYLADAALSVQIVVNCTTCDLSPDAIFNELWFCGSAMIFIVKPHI